MAKDRFFQGFTAYPLRTFRLLTHLGRLIALSYLLHDIKMMKMKTARNRLSDHGLLVLEVLSQLPILH